MFEAGRFAVRKITGTVKKVAASLYKGLVEHVADGLINLSEISRSCSQTYLALVYGPVFLTQNTFITP